MWESSWNSEKGKLGVTIKLWDKISLSGKRLESMNEQGLLNFRQDYLKKKKRHTLSLLAMLELKGFDFPSHIK